MGLRFSTTVSATDCHTLRRKGYNLPAGNLSKFANKPWYERKYFDTFTSKCRRFALLYLCLLFSELNKSNYWQFRERIFLLRLLFFLQYQVSHEIVFKLPPKLPQTPGNKYMKWYSVLTFRLTKIQLGRAPAHQLIIKLSSREDKLTFSKLIFWEN